MRSENFYDLIQRVFSDTIGKSSPQGVIVVRYTGLEIYGRLGQSAPIAIESGDNPKISLGIPAELDREFLHITPYFFDPNMFEYRAKKMIKLENIIKFGRRELYSDVLRRGACGFEVDEWFYAQSSKSKSVELKVLS